MDAMAMTDTSSLKLFISVITFERDVVLKNACVILCTFLVNKSVVNDTSHHELYLAFKKLQLSWRKRPQAETLKLEHSPSTMKP